MSRNIIRCINAHSPELENIKMCFMNANTFLFEQNRPFGINLNSNNENKEYGREDN